jgi:hypothetical protein
VLVVAAGVVIVGVSDFVDEVAVEVAKGSVVVGDTLLVLASDVVVSGRSRHAPSLVTLLTLYELWRVQMFTRFHFSLHKGTL